MTASLNILLMMALLIQASAGSGRPFRGQAHPIPGTIEAEDFDEGGEGVAYHDREAENLEKKRPAYRESGVDLERREAASNQYNLGWTQAGEWLAYTVVVSESGTYRLEMMVASEKVGGRFHIEIGGVDRTGPMVIPDTGGWHRLAPLTKDGVRLERGTYVMRVLMDADGASGSVGDIDFFRFVQATGVKRAARRRNSSPIARSAGRDEEARG